MKPTSSNRGLLVAVLAISTGCATFVNPSTQPVTIVSDPPAAEVIVDSEGMGSTPTDVLLRRSDSEAAVRLQKDGFAPRVVRPRRSLSRWWIANLVVPALLSATLVPAGPGAAFPGKAGAFLRSSGSVPPSRPIAAFAGMAGIAFLTDLLITGDGFAFPDALHTELAPAATGSTDLHQKVNIALAPDFRLDRIDGGYPDAPAPP
ncbi:MAG: PEGA domain-containing protein, partial [Acidobacteria bacterium]|nr:PEGA domain-containing protein [Acidobacteriota bacterium]